MNTKKMRKIVTRLKKIERDLDVQFREARFDNLTFVRKKKKR